ncbi:MAG: 4'-phosphopantetheinyl transferase superfamily protein [Bacteroidales bacterium]|nr:4'-phosphopantetheinyl transferase superfamily protein [Candidatus Equimonas enterica]
MPLPTIYIYDVPEVVTPEALAADLMRLPDFRREQALRLRSLRRRMLSAKAYLLLQHAVREVFGCTTTQPWRYGPHGKPMLTDCEGLHFSLSHCPRAVLCAVGTSPLGADIEAVPAQLRPSLLRYCCSAEEVAAVEADADPRMAFTRLWTRKEALAKYTGEGIMAHRLPHLLTEDAATGLRFQTEDDAARGVAFSLCTAHYAADEEACEVRFVHPEIPQNE